VILRIDHIGLATEDPEGVAAFMTTLGMRKYDEGHADDYGVACEFWQFGGGLGNPAVEIVSPTQQRSAIGGRLERQGPGLYHLAFEVDDLESETARLRSQGFTAIDAEPCKGAREGMTVAFLYAPAPANLLLELVHYAPDLGRDV
jgi:methylmalonyl-CoA/ethylmalonyl-CoA epimerase